MRRSTVAYGVAVLALLTACAGPAGSPSAPSPSSGSPTSASPSPATTAQWCSSYAALSGVLSTSGTASQAPTGLQALDRFALLWQLAGRMGIITADEVAANLRAVEKYRAIVTLVAAGSSSTSAAMTSARAALTAQTDSDRAVLSSSAGKVLGSCGQATASASA